MPKKGLKKSRTTVAKATKPRPRTRKRAKNKAPLALAKQSLTIRFKNEHDLRERLRQVLSLFDEPAPSAVLTRGVGAAFDVADAAAEPCMPLLAATAIVVDALAPKAFSPPEKLGTTYLIPQERELFRQRVVDRVKKKSCVINPTDVPSDEGATHGAVVSAVRQNAN